MEEAEETLRSAIDVATNAHQDDYLPSAMQSLAMVLVDTDRLDDARDLALDALALAIEADPTAVADCVEVLVQTEAAGGDLEEAAFLVSVAEASRGSWVPKIPPHARAAREERIGRIREALGRRYAAANERGRRAGPAVVLTSRRPDR